MLHQAMLLSPSGAGLEATTAMHGDASQLQRAHFVQPFSGKVRQGHADLRTLSPPPLHADNLGSPY